MGRFGWASEGLLCKKSVAKGEALRVRFCWTGRGVVRKRCRAKRVSAREVLLDW